MIVFDILLPGCVFLLPGIALSLLIHRRRNLDSFEFAAVTLVNSAAMAYLVFWPYLVNARFGKAVTLLMGVFSVAAVFSQFRRIKLGLLRELGICALLMALVTTAYLAIGNMYHYSDDPIIQAQHRFIDLPPDNIIPYMFAARLYHSVPVKPWLYGEWKSSDRPPLSAGATLFQLPLWKAEGREQHYQALGVFLQSMWIAALWILLNSTAVPKRIIVVVCAFCAVSPTFLLYTYFVWPKFLAAALLILALFFLRFSHGYVKRYTSFEIGFAGAALALGVLSHPGVAFTAIGLGVYLLVRGALPPLRRSIWGIVAVVVLVGPWILYQKFYDPPGDRLVKWHLAGAREIDSRSFPRALIDAYFRASLGQIIDAKIQNFETLWGHGPLGDVMGVAAHRGNGSAKQLVTEYVNSNFFYVFQAVGLLDCGFVVLLFIPTFSRKYGTVAALDAALRLLMLSLVSIAIWCLMMYSPRSTPVHEGSLASVILLFVALAIILAVIAPWLTYTLLALQAVLFFPLYVIAKPFINGGATAVWSGLDVRMAMLGLASFSFLAVLGWRFGFCGSSEKMAPLNGTWASQTK